jgi:hypothetical protein
MTDETFENAEEFLKNLEGDEQTESEETQEAGQTVGRVMVGPHELGGIKVIVRDLEGEQHEARIDIQEVAMLYAHLGALLTMFYQTQYALAAQEAQNAQRLYVPRS